MEFIWRKLLFFLIFYPIFISSISIDTLYLNSLQQNLYDMKSFDKFYRDFLKDIKQHRLIDTVSSPIDIEKLRSNNYDENYLKNSVDLNDIKKKGEIILYVAFFF